jgi:hypothetical protein
VGRRNGFSGAEDKPVGNEVVLGREAELPGLRAQAELGHEVREVRSARGGARTVVRAVGPSSLGGDGSDGDARGIKVGTEVFEIGG